MAFDKWQAKRKQQRVSENNLFALAFVLGAIGIYLAMKAPLYHKTAKQKFKVGIPLLLFINLLIAIVLIVKQN